MKILVEIGGSGVRIRRLAHGQLREHTYLFKGISSCDMLFEKIYEMAQDNKPGTPEITGIAVSVPGECDYLNELVLTCYHYPFLIGPLKRKIQQYFNCRNVFVINDGDAHVLALKYSFSKNNEYLNLGAVNLALGTAVGFGALDVNGELIHNSEGHDWEISGWPVDTRASVKQAYFALGSQGLAELEDHFGMQPETYIIFGERLCKFIAQRIVSKFHPRTIGLSGGIVAAHHAEILEGIHRECGTRGYWEGVMKGIDIRLSQDRFSATTGLKTLFDRPETGNWFEPKFIADELKSLLQRGIDVVETIWRTIN